MNSELPFQITTALMFIAAFSTSLYFRAKAERQGGALKSRGSHATVLVLRLCALVVLAIFGIYIFSPATVSWLQWPLPTALRWVGVGLGLSLTPTFYWIFSNLGNNVSPVETTRQGATLVTSGPYRWVRHPLYTAGFASLLALTLITGFWWIGLAILPAVVYIVRRTPREEANLIATFGDDYRAYMQRTGRYLPKLW